LVRCAACCTRPGTARRWSRARSTAGSPSRLTSPCSTSRTASRLRRRRTRGLRFVRLSGRSTSDQAEADLAAVVRAGLDGIVVPKVARAAELAMLDEMLTERERAAKLPAGSVSVIASIESAAGLINAPEIARSPRLAGLMFGSEDFAADLGLPVKREAEAAELLYARSAIVVAAAAARILAFDGIWA